MTGRLSSQVLDLIAGRFRVLAEPARLRILNELMLAERTVTELVYATGLNQANLSKHLQVLRSLGFVERRKEGLYAHYRIADPSVAELCQIMCGRLEAEVEEQAVLLAGAASMTEGAE
jgi:DNA-binding transcriptional ArsR family regulator